MTQATHQRFRPWLAGALLALTLTLMPGFASAASVRVFLDGKELLLPTPPIVENDRTLVPARALLEALGATVGWDPATHTVSAAMGSMVITTIIGDEVAKVNGKAVQLDVPPRIVEGRTLIPLRFFAENLGLAVTWDQANQAVAIDSRKSVLPDRSGSTASRTALQAVELAKKQVGLPYSWGGTSPDTGFDCSGLVTYVTKQVGGSLPRTSQEMFDSGAAIEKANLLAGDLVFFTTYAPGPTHVGIYDGNGSFIHAQSTETGVRVTSLSGAWWVERYLGARRVYR